MKRMEKGTIQMKKYTFKTKKGDLILTPDYFEINRTQYKFIERTSGPYKGVSNEKYLQDAIDTLLMVMNNGNKFDYSAYFAAKDPEDDKYVDLRISVGTNYVTLKVTKIREILFNARVTAELFRKIVV